MLIQDIGPWDVHKTITNDAERVVQELYPSISLYKNKKLFYNDSEGVMDELLIADGFFAGFGSVNDEENR